MKFKIIFTIVKKGLAKKVVAASKNAGAEGGTIIMGKGTGIKEAVKFFGITVEPEKEIVFTLTREEAAYSVMASIVEAVNLNKPGHGVAFILKVKDVAGICHTCMLPDDTDQHLGGIEMETSLQYDLIVTIVNKGDSQKVVDASLRAGAAGGTILFGRGSGIHEQAKLFGITIEPEKEIILTLIERTKTTDILITIIKAADLDKPGKGIAFVLEVEKVAGINHLLNESFRDKINELTK
jgi:nitrogen regulatory protein PII